MRTEDDLRAAFGSLEGQLADGARILTGVARQRRRRTLRRRVGGVLAAAGISVAAVVAVVQVPAAPHSQLTAAAVRVKLLAAWAAAGNDILVVHSLSPGGGPSHAVESTADTWSYPWAASPGQREQDRLLVSYDGKKASDTGGSYTVLEPGAKPVSSPGIHVDYSSSTWSRVTIVHMGGLLGPSDLRSQIASGVWKVSGPTEFHGHQALTLTQTFTGHPAAGQTVQSATQLWVDASTYLPLYSYFTTSGLGAGPPVTTVFELLPPTPANLALLKPVIPPGFRQIGFTGAPLSKLPTSEHEPGSGAVAPGSRYELHRWEGRVPARRGPAVVIASGRRSSGRPGPAGPRS